MYFADTHRQLIWSYDFDRAQGVFRNERVFADCKDRPGKPDGSCVDADGCLWNAEWGGHRLVRYTPEGAIDRVIELPVSRPSCPVFGGPDHRTLYVTTARYLMSPEEDKTDVDAGSLYAIELDDVQGVPASLFAL